MEQESAVLTAIDRLGDLPEGWDSYEAPKITLASRRWAKSLVLSIQQHLGPHYANPTVGPTPEGGVALIWRKDRGSEIDVLCSPTGARYLLLSPHRQVVAQDAITSPGLFAIQVLKRLDL